MSSYKYSPWANNLPTPCKRPFRCHNCFPWSWMHLSAGLTWTKKNSVTTTGWNQIRLYNEILFYGHLKQLTLIHESFTYYLFHIIYNQFDILHMSSGRWKQNQGFTEFKTSQQQMLFFWISLITIFFRSFLTNMLTQTVECTRTTKVAPLLCSSPRSCNMELSLHYSQRRPNCLETTAVYLH